MALFKDKKIPNSQSLVKLYTLLMYVHHFIGGFLYNADIDLKLGTTFGYSILSCIFILLFTYNRKGKIYFTNKFRVLVYIMLVTSILRQLHFSFDIKFHQIIETTNYTFGIMAIVFIVGLIFGFNAKPKNKK